MLVREKLRQGSSTTTYENDAAADLPYVDRGRMNDSFGHFSKGRVTKAERPRFRLSLLHQVQQKALAIDRVACPRQD